MWDPSHFQTINSYIYAVLTDRNMKQHQTTIYDIAATLNISKSTVSRALTGHPSVKHETRQAILELAEKLEYQRNMLAISLHQHRTKTLGIIVPELFSYFFPSIIVGAHEVATAAGFNLIISHSNESYDNEVANARLMLERQVDGVMVSLTKETRNFDHLGIFRRKGVPLVQYNRVTYDIEGPKVVVDDYEGAFRAVEHLIQQGKRRIAHLAGPDSLRVSTRRRQGYLDALQKHDVPFAPELLIPYDLTISLVPIYINHLLGLPQPPDALFCINDPTAMEAMQVIKGKGLRIPEDMAVIGFSDDYYSKFLEPSLSSVRQPVADIGRTASRTLLEMLEQSPEQWRSHTVELKTELIVRQSS